LKNHALWLSASILTLGWCGAAAAQDTPPNAPPPDSGQATEVEEVVITAERRSTNLQRTPIAATVITGDDLAEKGVTSVDQLQFVSPGATVNNFGQGIDFNIRGIGKAEHNTQTTTGVITYRDGIATFPGYLQGEPYYDIASVEILRGPQGTFVGQNATGGAVFVTSNNPIIDGGHTGYFQGQLGNHSEVGGQGAVNLPINDTLAARIAFNYDQRDSFYSFRGPGGGPYTGNPGDIQIASGRFSLLWQPSASLSVLFKTDYNYLDYGAYPADPVLATNDPFHLTANSEQRGLDRMVRSSVKVDYTFDNGVVLRSLSGYQFGNTQYRGDLDGTNLAFNTFRDSVDEEIWSQEFNLISPDTGPLTWVLGVYYQEDTYDFLPGQFVIGVPPGSIFSEYRLEGTNPKTMAAVFGQVSYDLTDSLELQVGLRYSSAKTTNHIDVSQYGTPISQDQSAEFDDWSGKVSLNWTVDQHNFLYAFVASGFRPGGLNVPVGIVGSDQPFDSEKVLSGEVGWKAGFFNGRLRTQIDAYYNRYEDFQVIIGYPDLPIFGFELNTPEPTEIYGFEAQVEARFGAFSLDAGVGIMHTEIGRFFATDPRATTFTFCDPNTGPASLSCIDLTGHEQTYAPNFTFNVGAEYEFALGNGDTITPRINFGHVSEQWATLFENRARGDEVEARNIWNGQLSWRHDDLVLTVYGTNLGDQHYMGALNSGLRFMGPPRQYGVRLLKTF
jgi:iron complex outermembrane receptor protein